MSGKAQPFSFASKARHSQKYKDEGSLVVSESNVDIVCDSIEKAIASSSNIIEAINAGGEHNVSVIESGILLYLRRFVGKPCPVVFAIN